MKTQLGKEVVLPVDNTINLRDMGLCEDCKCRLVSRFTKAYNEEKNKVGAFVNIDSDNFELIELKDMIMDVQDSIYEIQMSLAEMKDEIIKINEELAVTNSGMSQVMESFDEIITDWDEEK